MKFGMNFVFSPGMIRKKMDLTSLHTHVFSYTTSHFSRLKLERMSLILKGYAL